MKFFLRKNLKLAFLIALPMVLFAMLREKASWRPQPISYRALGGMVCISPHDRFLAHASSNGTSQTISWVNLSNGAVERRWSYHRKISAMAFSPDEKLLAASWFESNESGNIRRLGVTLWSRNGSVRELEVVTKNLTIEYPDGLCFSPDGKTIWLVSSGNLRQWTLADGKLRWQWRDEDAKRYPLAETTSIDCRYYFRCIDDNYLVYDIMQKKPVLQFKDSRFLGKTLVFSPDASLAIYDDATYDEYGNMTKFFAHVVIEARTGRTLWRSTKSDTLKFAGDKIVFVQKNKLKICNARTGKFLYELSAKPRSYLLPFASKDWLYSLEDSGGNLFRQRFR